MNRPTLVAGVDARHTIAAAIVNPADTIRERVGAVTLRPDQRAAIARLIELIADHGGAMLADPVGLGKTFAALGVAKQLDTEALIVAPASLGEMWRYAAVQCELDARIITHEALSRGQTPTQRARLIIVDESHRFRSPDTRRYAVLADLCQGAMVLLLTATPVHNSRRDLSAQLALFMGRGAWELSDAEAAAHVVRRADVDASSRPVLDGPHPVALPPEDDHLDAIVALPPPLPARDEQTSGVLLTYSLLHQWASSRAALLAALERRRARSYALTASLDAGRLPSRAELQAWTHAEDSVQLAFPELVISSGEPDTELAALRATVEVHLDAVDALRRRLKNAPNPDASRAAALRHIRSTHPGERIIAFAQYAETVAALRAHLTKDGGIATLTSHGARVASGRVSRAEVLEQFAPGHCEVEPAQRIDLLICTDLLSEGLNLQEASVIVHLDLPWNPARLEQRVGRALRLGSRHTLVTVYTFSPPASADALLRIESRLRQKLAVAQRAIGVAGRILPSPFTASAPPRGMAEELGAARSIMREWLTHGRVIPDTNEPFVAAVADAGDHPPTLTSSARSNSFLALVHDGEQARLIAGAGSDVTEDPATIRAALGIAVGCDVSIVDREHLEHAQRLVAEWLRTQRALATIDLRAAGTARARRATLARVAETLARAPRHRRSVLAPLAAAARAVATTPFGEGAERVLEMLVQAELPDEAWLRSIVAFAELNSRPLATMHVHSAPRLLGMILLPPNMESPDCVTP